MLIHFVCSGNTNRSRMAEAYLNSKQIPGIEVSSSGIYASHNLNGALSEYARFVLAEAGILSFTSEQWQETTRELLEGVDVVVFMDQKHYDFCVNELNYVPKKYYIWNILDVEYNPAGDNREQMNEKIIEDEEIYTSITKKVDELIKEVDPNEEA